MSIEDVTALDATFLELEEADESAHMHIGSVALFEPGSGGGPPTLDQLRAKLVGVADDMPRFRQRLSQPRTGGLHWPQWVDDEAFDVANHVRQAGLPAPAGERELREWAGDYFSSRLDRARPLWEIVLIRLGDGRWAMVSKTHHCMVDGVGSVDIGQALLDTDPDAPGADGRRRRGSTPTSSRPRRRRTRRFVRSAARPRQWAPPRSGSRASAPTSSVAPLRSRPGRPTPPCTPSTPARRGTGRGRWPASWSPTRWSAHRPPASTGRSARRAASRWSRSRSTT